MREREKARENEKGGMHICVHESRQTDRQTGQKEIMNDYEILNHLKFINLRR